MLGIDAREQASSDEAVPANAATVDRGSWAVTYACPKCGGSLTVPAEPHDSACAARRIALFLHQHGLSEKQ
jgi:predicted RNA-binding Zn-ribbon protein involved in translation (DUF1610 family)